MKKLSVCAVVVMVAMLIALRLNAGDNYYPYTVDVPGSSAMILPATTPDTTNEWVASTAFSQGDYIRLHTNNIYRFYWAIVGGTTDTNTPTWTTTNTVTDNTVTWKMVNKKRGKYYIQNLGIVTNVSLAFNNTAATNSGITLFVEGDGFSERDGAFQGAIYGISKTDSTNTVTIQELP